jgi:hypothetical protein
LQKYWIHSFDFIPNAPNKVAKKNTARKKIIIPRPKTIVPSSRTVIGEGKDGGVDDDVTVHVCSIMRGGSSVLYRLSQCQELIIDLLYSGQLFLGIQCFLKYVLPEIKCRRIVVEICTEHEYQGIWYDVFVDCK